jgi:hypothetical protein
MILDSSYLLNAVQLYMLQRDMLVRFFLDYMRQYKPPWSVDRWEEWLSDEPFGVLLPRELQDRIMREWSNPGRARHQLQGYPLTAGHIHAFGD